MKSLKTNRKEGKDSNGYKNGELRNYKEMDKRRKRGTKMSMASRNTYDITDPLLNRKRDPLITTM